MREAIRQALSFRSIEVDKADFPYVELQVQLIRQLESHLKATDLQEVVPALIYEVEVAND